MPGARAPRTQVAAAVAALLLAPGAPLGAQAHVHEPAAAFRLTGMAQAIPVLTHVAAPGDGGLAETAAYLTQPVLMALLAAPDDRLRLRLTLDFEGLTLGDGELTPGGWGEGFLDKRHPHTLLHELVLTARVPAPAGIRASVSAGRGFAPYGTADPMSRPALKYPTNHHLSQVLERWLVAGAVARSGWTLEAGLFGGQEPAGPWDLDNLGGFADSWALRLTRRFGGDAAGARWELSGSVARVKEQHHDDEIERTRLWNAAVRHRAPYALGRLYALLEYSFSQPTVEQLQVSGLPGAEPLAVDGHDSLLAEAELRRGAHAPYARVEYATRPEYQRLGPRGGDGFFRYDPVTHSIGATRWLAVVAGWTWHATAAAPIAARPFIEVGWARSRAHRGAVAPERLYGRDSLWTLSVGARLYAGGGPMRMGAYGAAAPDHLHRGTTQD